jgi:hypothetical protein
MSSNDYEEDPDDDDEFNDDKFQGPKETEVEEKEISLGDQKLTFKIFLLEDDYEFAQWMQTILVHCSHDGKDIGRGVGRHVDRDWIRPTFWRDMEEPCVELSTIAFQLFDRYGRLKKEFKDHPVQKGTGVWGSELDFGQLFIIEYMHVDDEWRRKGVGRNIAKYLIEKSRTGGRSPQFSLAVPGWLTAEPG